MAAPIIAFDYVGSPYAQKVRLLLAAANIPYKRCDQPAMLPRPTFEKLGITHRRVPLLAIGKDVYCDSSAIITVLQKKFDALPTSGSDRAFESFGDETFQRVLGLIPPERLTEGFVKDRETIFPTLARPDYKTLRPSGLGEFKATLYIVENEFLGKNKWIGGKDISLADVQVGWVVRWALQGLGIGREPGFGKADFPRVYQWIESFPTESSNLISDDAAKETILGSQYSEKTLGVSSKDPLGIQEGTAVSVETIDSKPGAHPQTGILVALDTNEYTIELLNGIRLHFPRRGYVVRKDVKGTKKVFAPVLSDGHSP